MTTDTTPAPGLDAQGNIADPTQWLAANPTAPQWLREIVETVRQTGSTMAIHPGNLAWADDQAQTGTRAAQQVPATRSWPTAVVWALVLVAAGVLAGAAVWVGWHKATDPYKAPAPAPPVVSSSVSTSTVVVTTTEPAPSSTQPAATTPAALPPTSGSDPLTVTDRAFLARLDQDVPPRSPGTDSSAVATALAVCRALGSGQSAYDVETTMSQQYLTRTQAHYWVLDAVEFYCPHALGS